MKRADVENGDIVRDIVTGYEGMTICIAEWLSGCRRITVQSKGLKEGKPVEAFTFDVEQLEIVSKKEVPKFSPTGGPCPEPTRNEQ